MNWPFALFVNFFLRSWEQRPMKWHFPPLFCLPDVCSGPGWAKTTARSIALSSSVDSIWLHTAYKEMLSVRRYKNSSMILKNCYLSNYQFIWKAENKNGREREGENFPFVGFTSQILAMVSTRQGRSQEPGNLCSSPPSWLGPESLDYVLLPSLQYEQGRARSSSRAASTQIG